MYKQPFYFDAHVSAIIGNIWLHQTN